MPRARPRKSRRNIPVIDVAIGIIARDGRLLVCQRKPEDSFGNFWEFPGGKREPRETIQQCLKRELIEELDIRVAPFGELKPIIHAYPTATVKLFPIICRHVEGEPKLIECQKAVWIEPVDLVQYRFPPANEGLIAEVIGFFTGKPMVHKR
jgi:mutator protein MutT